MHKDQMFGNPKIWRVCTKYMYHSRQLNVVIQLNLECSEFILSLEFSFRNLIGTNKLKTNQTW